MPKFGNRKRNDGRFESSQKLIMFYRSCFLSGACAVKFQVKVERSLVPEEFFLVTAFNLLFFLSFLLLFSFFQFRFHRSLLFS